MKYHVFANVITNTKRNKNYKNKNENDEFISQVHKKQDYTALFMQQKLFDWMIKTLDHNLTLSRTVFDWSPGKGKVEFSLLWLEWDVNKHYENDLRGVQVSIFF